MPSLTETLFGFSRPVTRGERVFFRVFEAFVAGLAVYLAWRWAFYIPRISNVVMPVGLAQYVDISFLYVGRRAFLLASLLTVLATVGFLHLWRGAYLCVFLLLHLQYVARFSLGKIQHGSNILGLTLLALALAMLAFRSPTYRRRFSLGFTYFFVGLGYPISAFCKLVGTGLTWPDGRHMAMWIHEKSIDAFAQTGAFNFNLLQEWALNHWWIATAFLVASLLTELSGFLLWWRRFRLPVGMAILGLHLGIYAVVDILFLFGIMELVLLVFPRARWIDAPLERAGRSVRLDQEVAGSSQ